MSIKAKMQALRHTAMQAINRPRSSKIRSLLKQSKRLTRIAFASIARQDYLDRTPLPGIEFIVYYGDNSASSHFKMWDPVFAQRRGSYASIFRAPQAWRDLSERYDVFPVHGLAQLEPLFARMPDLKAVFYIANNGTNMQAVRCGAYTHVFLGHGDSTKSSSANKMFRLYDEIWVAGQAHIDRFASVPGDYSSLTFKIIGQPWTADWLRAMPEHRDTDRREWAYLPTWRGYYDSTRYASLDHAQDIIAAAGAHASNGHIKLHPWTSAKDLSAITDAAQDAEINIPDPATPLRDILARPLKFVICDASAALTEALVTGLPIFLYQSDTPDHSDPSFAKTHAFCYLFKSMNELNTLLTQVIKNGDDPLAEARAHALSYYHDTSATRSGAFLAQLDALSKTAPLTDD